MADKQTIQVTLKMVSDIKDITSNVGAIQSAINSLKLPDKLKTSFTKTFDGIEKETSKIQGLMTSGFKKQGDVTALEKSYQKINQLMFQLQQQANQISPGMLRDSFQVNPKELEELNKQLANAQQRLTTLLNGDQFKGFSAKMSQILQDFGKKGGISSQNFIKAIAENDIPAAEKALKTLESTAKATLTKLEKGEKTGSAEHTAAKEYLKQIQELQTSLTNFANSGDVEGAKADIANISNLIENLAQKRLDEFIAQFPDLKEKMEMARQSAENFGKTSVDTANSLNKTAQDVDHLKNSILNFFSIGNAVQLFKRAVNSALETVKELDATMTEAAVVTEFSVGDMWGKLPQYSQEASQLGARINDLYGATTLYYQQGLKTNEAMGVGVETMKMARIANMDATEATTAMTAALRGFNMEVNEMNAQTVNDVYSELAAITAADTSQIATAMSKTASIASSANMEFENTAALLAQIIETTQEAPETAGTALKTIIARFSEVKKLANEGQSTGEDEEGEVIDVNKIQTALRTVGISMDDFFKGTEGLEDVLLRLAEKWDTLDFETQRYIATTAAGSRQQSRFIAMMSDYERTVELTNAANNSAGASTEQFNKTLDSLDSKLNELKNAWDTFIMGLFNSDLLKAGVETLTFLLETLNKIIDTLSGGSGIVKTFVTAMGLLSAFKIGRGLLGGKGQAGPFDSILKSMGYVRKEAQKEGEGIGKNLVNGIKAKITGIKEKGFKESLLNAIGIKKGVPILEKNYTKIFDLNSLNFENVKPEGMTALKENILTQVSGMGLSEEINDKIRSSLSGDSLDVDGINKALEGTGKQIQLTGKEAAQAGATLNKFGASMDTMGQAAATVGGLLMIAAEGLESLGVGEEVTTVIKAIGVALMTLPVIFQVVQVAAQIFSSSVTTSIVSIPVIGWIIGVVAALGVLAGILINTFKADYANSLEGKLEAAKKATDAAEQSAKAAKEEYDNLLQDRDEFNELQKTLEGLTKGTNEWKQALLEANNQVLQLLNTYPKLAEYLSRGEDGQLVISDEGFEKVLADQEKGIKAANASLIMNQVRQTNLSAGGEKENLTEEYEKLLINAGIPLETIINSFKKNPAIFSSKELTEEEFSKLSQEEQNKVLDSYGYTNRPDLFFKDNDTIKVFNEDLLKLANGSSQTAMHLATLEGALTSYTSAVLAAESTNLAMTEGLLTTAASQETLNYEYSDAIISSFAQPMSEEEYSTYIDDYVYDEIYNTESSGSEDAKRKELMESRDLDVVGNENQQIEALYKDVMKVSEIPAEIEGNYKEMSKAIAYALKTEEKVAKLEEFRLAMQEKLTDEEQKQLSAFISKDTSKLSMGELKALEGTSQYELLTKIYGEGSEAEAAIRENLGYDMTFFEDLSDTEQKAVARFALEKEGKKPEEITDENINSYITEQEQKGEVISLEAQLFLEDQKFQEQITQVKTEATKAFNNKGILVDSGFLSEISPALLSNLAKQTQNLSKQATEDYLKEFEQVVSQKSGNAKNVLSNYLSTVDWSDMSQAVEAMEYLQTQGFDTTEVQNFWEKATGGANAFVTSIGQALNLTERFQQKLIGISEIESRLSDGKGTYEDVQYLVEAGVDISNFQLTAEGWQASAEEIEVATEKLKEQNAINAENTLTRHNKAYEAAISNVTDNIIYDEETGRFSITDKGLGGITSVDDNGKLIGGEVTLENAGSMLGVLGEDGKREDETNEAYIARIQQAYDNYINLLNTGEETSAILEKAAAMAEAAKYSSAEAEALGHSDESIIYSAQNEAIEAGLDVNEMTAYAEHLQNINEGLNKVTATQVALANSKMNLGLGEIIESYDEWTGLIDENTGTIKASSSEDVAAYNKLKKSVNTMLNTSEDLSDAFWDNAENMDNLKKAAEGDTEALEALQKAAASDYLNNIDLGLQVEDVEGAKSAIQEFSDYIQGVDIPNLEAGVQWNGEGSQEFINAFNDMAAASNLSAEQIQESVKAMGFDAEIEYVKDTRMVPSEYTERVIDEYDPSSKMPTKWHTVTTTGQPQSITGYFPVVKTLTSTGSGGGGISTGNIDAGKQKKGGGGGGSSKPKTQHWENPYDELHNKQEQIDETLRDRNQLEIDYDRILKDRTKTFKDLYENQKDQLANLERERSLQKELLEGRKRQLKNLANESYIATKRNGDEEEQFRTTFAEEFKRLGLGSIDKYMGYDQKTGELWIDWDRIEAIEKNEKTGEDQGALIEALKSRYDEVAGQIEETEDTLYEIDDKVAEILEQGREDYEELEQQVYDAIVADRQLLIDNYSTLSETLSESSSNMLTALQESIDLERQIRDNTKQEEDIAEMEARLAYLRADTSSGNRLEILELEEQLAEARESYGDTLVDQEIERLNKANEEAAEQRERQIEIMQSQLDYQQETGYFWEQAHDLIAQLVENDGKIDPSSPLGKLLTANSDWKSMSEQQKATWVDDLEQTIMSGLAWIIGEGSSRQLEKIDGIAGKTVTFRNSKGETLTGTVNKDGSVTTADGETYKDVVQMFNGDYTTAEEAGEKKKESPKTQGGEQGGTTSLDDNEGTDKGYFKSLTETIASKRRPTTKSEIKTLQKALNAAGFNAGSIDGIIGEKTTAAIRKLQKAVGVSADGIYGPKTHDAVMKSAKYKAFKTGGLADFTGPAWLDGTKSHPELVLNQQDTKNFIVLKDILADALGAMSGKTSAQGGDNYFDIDIIVDEIGSDYDVDQLSERIKQNIYEDGMYRNVNTISLQR